MELRRISLCVAVVVLGVFSHCSEARHAIQRRATEPEDVNYDDPLLADEASDDEALNDDGGNDADDDDVLNGTILTKAATYTINLGKAVQLECKVYPSSGLVITWYKDDMKYFIGALKTDLSLDRFSIPTNSTDLLIKDLKPEDSGNYRCEITQEDPVFIEHTVIVVAAPRIIRFIATTNPLKEGEDLLLTCDVSGSPKPGIIWSRETKTGLNERLTERDGEFSSNTFFARNVSRSMTGKYYCYAVNNLNESSTALVDLVVIGKPRVHVHRTIVNSDFGVEAVLQCSVHEESRLYFHWYKDSKPIEDTANKYIISTSGSTSNLTVTPQTDQDFGTFTCEAENPHGRHNRSIDLVQSPVVENFDIDGLKLSWTVHSHQPLQAMEIQLRSMNGDGNWTTINVPLPEAKDKHVYDVIYVLEDKQFETGKYEATVKVRNGKSWSAHTDPSVLDIETQAQLIQTASVFRSTGNNAYSARTTKTAVLSTILMYLLVRTL